MPPARPTASVRRRYLSSFSLAGQKSDLPPREVWLRGALLPRFHPATLRAALWTFRSLRYVRRRLDSEGLQTRAPQPPVLPWGSSRGVQAVIRRQESTCLERAIVLQQWLTAHGKRHDVVVGVKRDGTAVAAHAWLDFEAGDPQVLEYKELTRVTP